MENPVHHFSFAEINPVPGSPGSPLTGSSRLQGWCSSGSGSTWGIQHLEDSTVPGEQYSSWRTVPGGQYLDDSTWRALPGGQKSTWRTVSGGQYLEDNTEPRGQYLT